MRLMQKFFLVPVKACRPAHVEVADVQLVHALDVGIHLTSVVSERRWQLF